MPSFEKIAPFLNNELVLAGFVLFLVVGLMRLILGLKIFRKITSKMTHSFLMRMLTYGFVLALCGLVGGFGLAAYRASLEHNSNGSTSANEQQIEPLVKPSRVNIPTDVDVVPRAVRILEGNVNSEQRRLFDITIENPLGRQLMLDTWEIEWQYFRGALSGVAHAAVIEPVTEHFVELTVDPNKQGLNKQSIPISPDIVLPAASSEAPSIHKFRLELIYKLKSQNLRHATSDWNIVFSINVRTIDGHEIALFLDQKWRA